MKKSLVTVGYLLNAEFDGALSVRIPLSHDGKDLRDGRFRIDEQLKAFEAAQVEISRVRRSTLRTQRSLSRWMGDGKRSDLIRLQSNNGSLVF